MKRSTHYLVVRAALFLVYHTARVCEEKPVIKIFYDNSWGSRLILGICSPRFICCVFSLGYADRVMCLTAKHFKSKKPVFCDAFYRLAR